MVTDIPDVQATQSKGKKPAPELADLPSFCGVSAETISKLEKNGCTSTSELVRSGAFSKCIFCWRLILR